MQLAILTKPVQYAGHQCLYDGMIVGPVAGSIYCGSSSSLPSPFFRRFPPLHPHPSNPRRNPLAPHQYSMPLNCFLTRTLFLSLSFSFTPRQFYFLTRFRNRHSVKHNPLTVFLTRQAKIWRLI